MITGDYDQLKDLASRHVCSEHGTPLEVAWYGDEKTWVLRCGHGHYPEMITRQLSLTEEYKAGEEIPEPIKSNIEKGRRKRAMEQGRPPVDIDKALVPQTDLGSGQLLLPEEVVGIINYAEKYHLDPYRGHVVIMYGKPYITIDGYLYHAHGEHIPFTISSHPIELGERDKYMLLQSDHAWLCEVRITETGATFSGLGVVTQEEIEAKSEKRPGQLKSPVVAKHPWQLAQKRAEWQALRRAFPIGETQEEPIEPGDKD